MIKESTDLQEAKQDAANNNRQPSAVDGHENLILASLSVIRSLADAVSASDVLVLRGLRAAAEGWVQARFRGSVVVWASDSTALELKRFLRQTQWENINTNAQSYISKTFD